MLDRLRKKTAGFTLVEMLIVMAVIAMLVTIAIPQFIYYRKRGFESQVTEDLRNAAVAQESYFAANQIYKNGALTSNTPPGYNQSAPVNVTATVSGNAFTLTAIHASCASVSWTYSSTTGTITGGPCP